MTYRDYSDLDIVEVFIDVQNELGYPPSVTDIERFTGISWNTVERYLWAAELRGEVFRQVNTNGETASYRPWRLAKPKPPWKKSDFD